MPVDAAYRRLRELADLAGGTVTAAVAEADPLLAGDRDAACAAARRLASDPGVAVREEGDAGQWFPYSLITISER